MSIDQENINTGVEQHSIARSITLHLLPGVLALIVFVITGPIFFRNNLPSILGLVTAVFFVLIPFQLGYLFVQARRKHGTWKIQSVIPYRNRIPLWQYLVFVPVVFGLMVFFMAVVGPLMNETIRVQLFSWLPSWFQLGHYLENLSLYSKTILVITWVASLLITSILGPIVEELYFRGYLLPRMARLGRWAPLVHTVLFTMYHLWSPWLIPIRIFGVLPLSYTVWWRKNVYIGIVAHCLLNICGDSIMVIALIFA
jgi:membrane protease YdiL (CAAX protease family)